MKNCLVVYYSRTGMTRRVAEQIANSCQCDIEAIHEARSREGITGFLRSAYESLAGKEPQLQPAERDPSDYQLVILGTPVWAGHMSSPMRSYIGRNRNRFNRIAVFSTMGGRGGDKAMEEMAALCGKVPAVQLALTDDDIVCGRRRDEILHLAQEPPAMQPAH